MERHGGAPLRKGSGGGARARQHSRPRCAAEQRGEPMGKCAGEQGPTLLRTLRLCATTPVPEHRTQTGDVLQRCCLAILPTFSRIRSHVRSSPVFPPELFPPFGGALFRAKRASLAGKLAGAGKRVAQWKRVRVAVCAIREKWKWTHWGLNPGPSACEADVIPLHHVPI